VSRHGQRRANLVSAFPDAIDAFLISRVVNVRYLTGFTGSNAALLVMRDGPAVFATDGRYLTQAAAEVPDLECVDARSCAFALVERAVAAGVRQVGIEAADVTLSGHAELRAAAGDRLTLVDVEPIVERLRAVKDADELAALGRACAITDAAFADVTAQLRPGVTELDIAWSLQCTMRDHGASGLAFDSIVAFGPHSAIPHHEPTDRQLAAGDLVKLDFGARYDGYHADMTRTIAMAPVADWQRELHALVRDVQQRCAAAAVVGALPRDLDAMARDGITSSGHQVAHGLGHGVGLEIHELPFLSVASTAAALVDNVAVTIEPGIYLAGQGGVRIEDTVVVTNSGPTSLTTSPRDLLEIT
jgi:Xaa-Pro aminopeptidase